MHTFMTNYVASLFLEKNWFGFPPERRMMNIMKEAMLKENQNNTHYGEEDAITLISKLVKDNSLKMIINHTIYSDEIAAFKKDCAKKLEYDIAAVIVSIDSPTFSRTTKNLRVTFQGKLASIGKNFKIIRWVSFCKL